MNFFKNQTFNIGLPISILLIGYLVNPFNLGFFFGYLFLLIIPLKKKFLLQNLDLNFLFLLFFSVTYATFFSIKSSSGNQYILIYATFPPIFYLLGKFLLHRDLSVKRIILLIIGIGVTTSFSSLVSVSINFFEGGFSQLDRSIPSVWNGELISATRIGAYLTLNMCIPALFIANISTQKKIHKIFAGIIFIITLICVLRIGSRTQLGIMLITSLTALFYVMPRQSFNKNILLFCSLGLVIYLVYRNVSFDLNADWLTTFAGRMEKGTSDIASGGGRTDRWVKSIEYLFKKPLGWNVEEFGHAHNLWLDVLRVSGIIPFFLLIIFSFRAFAIIWKTVRANSKNVDFKALILVYGLSFFLLFMVEPIFEGMFSLFVLFCLFTGMIAKYRTIHLVNH